MAWLTDSEVKASVRMMVCEYSGQMFSGRGFRCFA
jgi:hypothetical protein